MLEMVVAAGLRPGSTTLRLQWRDEHRMNAEPGAAANIMSNKRDSERIQLNFPIRVSLFGGRREPFSEETHTIEVNRMGARIALQHSVVPNEVLRVVNLENMREADFRVVDAIRLEPGAPAEWGMECLEPEHNLWEIKFAPPVDAKEETSGALMICGDCCAQNFVILQDWELEILKKGPLQRFCADCGGPTNWQYADISRHAVEAPATEAASAGGAMAGPEIVMVERNFKRLAMKMPALIRDKNGREELSKTENLSKGGIAVSLHLILEVGDIVSVYCPYSENGHNMEQRAEVRNRRTFFAGERWVYGLRYVSS
jgi:hypothetical protein